MERTERARFGWAAFAIIFGVIANDIRNVLSDSADPQLQSLSVVAADLTIVMPLALTYAILKRHVIDVRFVISRTVVYVALTTVIVAVIGAVDWVTSAYLTQVRVAMAIDAAVTIGLAFVLHRAYGWIERAVDFLLFRRKHAAETYLRRLSKTLLRAQREETIDRALVHAPYERLDVSMAALFRAQGGAFVVSCAAGCDLVDAPPLDLEHELVRFLTTERSRLEIRDMRSQVVQQLQAGGSSPAVAIPIFQGDELTAFAVYGIHRDGTKLDPDEVETLERLCDTAAQAYIRIELLRYRKLSQPLPA
jgi:GAF domain-containing protein